MDSEVSKALSLPEIRYSHVWEDHRVLSKALCIQPQDVVVCITSSGDNVLNLLLDEPRKLVALDISEAQNSLLELKLSAIRSICYEDFLILLGEIEDPLGRWDDIYKRVKQDGCMPTRVQHYWDIHHKSLKSGGSWCGMFEKFMLELSREYLPPVLSCEQVDAFMSAQSLEEQRLVFDQWPIDNLKEAYCQFCRPSSQVKGRDVAQLKYVQLSEKEVKEILWSRFKRTCRNVPVRDNFYLSWLLRGSRGYDPLTRPDFAPPYLTREGFSKMKGLVDRVEVHTKTVEEYFDLTTSEMPTKLGLSNIFEYMSQESADVLFEKLASQVASGGRMAFWEYLNPRLPSTERLKQRLCRLEDVSNKLCQEDRFFAYEFHVIEVQ